MINKDSGSLSYSTRTIAIKFLMMRCACCGVVASCHLRTGAGAALRQHCLAPRFFRRRSVYSPFPHTGPGFPADP